MTPGTESEVGNGQGDSMGPSQSMEALAIETRAVEWLVAGCSFRVPGGVERRRTPSCWFADDGAFQVDSFAGLQMVFTVVSVMARVLGFTIGIDSDADGTPNGDKTGWTAARGAAEKIAPISILNGSLDTRSCSHTMVHARIGVTGAVRSGLDEERRSET